MATSFITVDELRVAVGRPTTDMTEAAPFTDSELQAIIDRHKANAEELIEQRLEKRAIGGETPIAADDLYSRESVSLTTDGPFAIGSVNTTTYYPFTTQHAWDSDGNLFTYDRNLDQSVNSHFIRRRYRLVDGEVHVIPSNTSTIDLYLPTKEEVNHRLGADIVENANTKIIQEARTTMQAQVVEGHRLEGTDHYGSDRDQ